MDISAQSVCLIGQDQWGRIPRGREALLFQCIIQPSETERGQGHTAAPHEHSLAGCDWTRT